MDLRERFFQKEKEKEQEEKKAFSLKDRLTVEECWSSYESNFYHWLNTVYYQRLLDYIRSKNSFFEEWQEQYGLDDYELKRLGIGNCVSGEVKYIYIAQGKHVLHKFVSNAAYIPDKTNSGPYFNCRYFRVDEFVPFNTWMESKEYNGDVPYVTISGTGLSKSAVYSDFIEIDILKGFRLLKMGGIAISNPPLNLRVKRVEYGNFARLTFLGRITTGSKELYLSDCFLDDLTLIDCDFALVVFERCKINNLKVKGSSLNSWSFVECEITGLVESSKLTNVNVKGGSCDLVLNDVKLSNVHGENGRGHITSWFRTLKTAYQTQGSDELAVHYYIKEKDSIRLSMKKSIWPNLKLLLRNRFRWKPTYLFISIIGGFLSLTIGKHFWGYAKKPKKVIYSSFVIIVFYLLLYILQYYTGEIIPDLSFWQVLCKSAEVSVSSFTTLGYFADSEFIKSLHGFTIVSESIFGAISFGALVGTLANQKY